MFRLVIHYEDKVRTFPVPQKQARLGTAPENEIVVPFPGVSRRHAMVRPRPEGVFLTDLGSTNGLIREGRRYDEVLLTPGKTVGLGRAILTLETLSSSDGETGLSLPGTGTGTDPDVSATAALLPKGSSPMAALRFVREVEQTGAQDPADLLRRARPAIGAETLLLFYRDGSEVVVTGCEGPLPSEEMLDRLDSETLLLVGGPDGLSLAAWFGSQPEPWQRDFFGYLSDKLLPDQETAALGPAIGPPGGNETLCFPPGMVIGTSAAVQGVLDQIRATVQSDLAVLLTGETGTGKELFARLIHTSGSHAEGPFIAINCAAIPAELLEAELFGVAGRVATGVDPRQGLFLQANGGTVFLDEIGDMPAQLQAKMLRVLQEREVLPLGAATPRKIDVCVLSASNRDLGRLVQEGIFRADLYYRLRGLELHIPPLRERREDLPPLLLAFMSRLAAKYRKGLRGVSRSALSLLLEHDWPGNIRELESEMERAVLLCPDGGTLQREHFSSLQRRRETAELPIPVPVQEQVQPADPKPLQEQVAALEREAIADALAAAQGNRTEAARRLGITRNGLALKMRRLRISQKT